MSWFLAFDLHLCLPLQLRSLSAVGFALLMYRSPWYPLALTYANGCGWNLYYCGTWGGRNFKGERFFAVDWHEEKLPSRGDDGLWVRRSEMRTVWWPHVHLCWRRIEFWPWVREPAMPDEQKIAELQQQREEKRQKKALKKQTTAAPTTLQPIVLKAALDAALVFLGGESGLLEQFGNGRTLEHVAGALSQRTAEQLGATGDILPTDGSGASEDIRRAALRVAGKCFGRFRQSSKGADT